MNWLTEKVSLSRTRWLMLLIATIYVVSPIDFVPELITGPIGLTDDAAAVALIATSVLAGRRAAKTAREPSTALGTDPR